MNKIITISNINTNEYFFTTDHCQKHNLGSDWVPCTFTIPMTCSPRKGLESGVINTLEEWRIVFGGKSCVIGSPDNKEIPNPDPAFQPVFN